MSLKVIELKFLLKLLGCEGYRGKIAELSPNSKTKAAERDRICQDLGSDGWVEYDSEISRFAIAPAGKTLLGLDTTSLPVTPDELNVLKACKRSMTPSELGRKVPASDRQNLIRNLTERGMLKISGTAIKEVRLSATGKQRLLNEYDPSGSRPGITTTMLGNYVRFLRENLGQSGNLPTAQPTVQSDEVMPIGSSVKPDSQAVLQQIKRLDQLVGNKNYLPIFHLRENLQPPLSRNELDRILYTLQREGQIDLSSLHDQGKYTQEQMSAGIRQDNGGYLFFVSIL